MALPLPRVVSDVGPGGGLVTALGGVNALRDAYYNSNYNKVKSELAKTTLGAEAASKLAYANMMGPQYLAKVFGNPDFLAGLTESQRSALPDLLLKAGVGQGGANSLNQMPMQPQMEQQPNNSFLDYMKHGVQNALGNFGMGGQANQNAMNRQQPNMGRPSNEPMQQPQMNDMPSSNNQSVEDEALSAWRATPEAQRDIPPGKNGLPNKKKLNEWYYGDSQAPMEMALNEGQRQKTLAEKSGQFLGTKEQGKTAGKFRAEALKDIGKSQLGLSHSGAVLNRLTNIVKSSEWQNMRKSIPLFQDKQLKYLSKMGTPEEQKRIGDFLSTAESFIASTVQGFSGKPLVREFDLAQRQKITPNDTVHVAEGKLKSAIALHDIAEKKNNIIKNLLKKGVDEADAVEEANKRVDVSKIEKQTDELLRDKPTEDDIDFTAKKHGMTREQVIQRLKAEGRYNG